MIDFETYKTRLQHVCNINSGSDNQDGVRAVQAMVTPWFEPIVDELAFVPLPNRSRLNELGVLCSAPVADAVVMRRRVDAPHQVLLGIHLDTVYGLDHPFQTVSHSEPNQFCGPGVADAKGGLIVMLAALAAFESRVAAGDQRAASVGWTVFLNPDEEIGSPCSAGLLRTLASKADFGMVYEPSLPDGTLIHARKGSGNYEVVVRGRSAHAGRDIANGRNAIAALCRLFGELERLGQPDGSVTVNLGRIRGGGPLNVVPDLAIGGWNVRVADQARAEWVQKEIDRCVEQAGALDGINVQVTGGLTSPPKPLDAPTQQLLSRIISNASQMGLSLQTAESGGVCDGNKLAAAGCPTIDTLGPRGGNIHSDREYVCIDSLDERAKLSELVLLDFAYHPRHFPARI
jgi:glutamate carboxypeptidase